MRCWNGRNARRNFAPPGPVSIARDERADRLLVWLVRREPARVDLGFLDRLDHVGLEPLDQLAAPRSARRASAGHTPSSAW